MDFCKILSIVAFLLALYSALLIVKLMARNTVLWDENEDYRERLGLPPKED